MARAPFMGTACQLREGGLRRSDRSESRFPGAVTLADRSSGRGAGRGWGAGGSGPPVRLAWTGAAAAAAAARVDDVDVDGQRLLAERQRPGGAIPPASRAATARQ
eukprot:4828966-Pyramimonas_sp.AAC.1